MSDINNLALHRILNLEQRLDNQKSKSELKNKTQSFALEHNSNGTSNIFELNIKSNKNEILNYNLDISSDDEGLFVLNIYANNKLIKTIETNCANKSISDSFIAKNDNTLKIVYISSQPIYRFISLKIVGKFYVFNGAMEYDYIFNDNLSNYMLFKKNKNDYLVKTYSSLNNLLVDKKHLINSTVLSNVFDVNNYISSDPIQICSIDVLKLGADSNLILLNSSDGFVNQKLLVDSCDDAIILPICNQYISKLIVVNNNMELKLLILNSLNDIVNQQDIVFEKKLFIEKLYSIKYCVGDTYNNLGFGFVDKYNKAYFVLCKNYTEQSSSYAFFEPMLLGEAQSIKLNIVNGYLYAYLENNDIVEKIQIDLNSNSSLGGKILTKITEENTNQIINCNTNEIYNYQNSYYMVE